MVKNINLNNPFVTLPRPFNYEDIIHSLELRIKYKSPFQSIGIKKKNKQDMILCDVY